MLESGHENNGEAEQTFHSVRNEHGIEDILHSISFVPKGHCRAIQLADLFAFYSRRNGVAELKAHRDGRDMYDMEMMTRVLTENLPHRSFVATAYGPDAGSLFLAGDP